MQRITDPTAVATLPPPPALTGTTGYFGPAVPGISSATRFRYWVANMWQEEMMSLLAAAGIAADTTGTVFNQVLLSIQALVGAVPHGVQAITSSGNFVVPAGVTAIEVEVWGGGSGSWASTTTVPGGGGPGGGYARKRISGLTPGAVIAVTIGAGGAAGTTTPLAPTGGTATSFGAYCSAGPGLPNPLNSTSSPSFGNQGGVGSGGDLNMAGGASANGIGWSGTGSTAGFNAGGLGGGGGGGGGMIDSGTVGLPGTFPGGGASGAGCPSGVAYNGAASAAGFCLVRW